MAKWNARKIPEINAKPTCFLFSFFKSVLPGPIAAGIKIIVAKANRYAAMISDGAFSCANRMNTDAVDTASIPKNIAAMGGIGGRDS